MSLILCIETGTDICSVALAKRGKLLSLRESEEGKNHAQNLAVFISEIFEENNVSSEELSAVAVGMRHGSYTGLRIGVSLAKGLCYADNIPLIGIGSLESLAMVALEDYHAGLLDITDIDTAMLCPMIDARRMEVYAGVYNKKIEPVFPVGAYIIDENSFTQLPDEHEFVIFGNGAAKCEKVLKREKLLYFDVQPSARGMVALAAKAFENKKFEDLAYFEPLYLKDFVAGVSKKNLLAK